MSGTVDRQAALDAAAQIVRLLEIPAGLRDSEWTDEFSDNFLKAVFEAVLPYSFQGPDHLWYFRYLVPRQNRFHGTVPGSNLDNFLDGFYGIAIFDGGDEPAYILSPGDIVSLKLFGKIDVRWAGLWGEQRPSEVLAEAVQARVGPPNEEFLPTLVRQSAKHALLHLAGIEQPGVLCLKLDRPDSATDLVFNAFEEDFANRDQYDDARRLLLHFLPRHLRRRTAFVRKGMFEADQFLPL